MSAMIIIDGAAGEGGGQILRTSLALSIITGQPFRIERIRAGRPKPGLAHQHLASVQAAAVISQARVTGAALRSTDLEFHPGIPVPGRHEFTIPTAGSALLLLQTILPPLMLAGVGSDVVIHGGTHNPFAPPFPFVERSFVPLLRRMGYNVTLDLDRAGFFPAGGGRLRARILPPGPLHPLNLTRREPAGPSRAILQVAGIPRPEAEAHLAAFRAGLGIAGGDIDELPTAGGRGSILWIETPCQDHAIVVATDGPPGTPVARAVREAGSAWRRLAATDAAIDEHLADQLLLPLVLGAGGTFTTTGPTAHTRTNAEVIARFLNRPVNLEPLAGTTWKISI